MSTSITRHDPNSPAPAPWKEATERRGQKYVDIALSFLRTFPVGTRIKQEEFDAWAMKAGLLTIPATTDKRSDAWKAFLMRRHELRYNINSASAHPRMLDMGEDVQPFVINGIARGLLEVESPEDAAARTRVGRDVERLVQHKRRQLAHLMQSADWAAMPGEMRREAAALYEAVDFFADNLHLHSKHLSARFGRFEGELKALVEGGLIEPSNGAIQAISSGEVVDAQFEVED